MMAEKTKRPRASQEVRDRAIAMREKGATQIEIAAALGCSKGAVNWSLLSAGAKKPNALPCAKHRAGPMHRRGHILVHPYNREDDLRLLELEASGLSLSEIARRMTTADPTRPRRHHSVKARLMTLACQEKRALAATALRSTALPHRQIASPASLPSGSAPIAAQPLL